jgi:hypothetical protein
MANFIQTFIADPLQVRNFTGSNAVNPWDRLVGGTEVNNCSQGKATPL